MNDYACSLNDRVDYVLLIFAYLVVLLLRLTCFDTFNFTIHNTMFCNMSL